MPDLHGLNIRGDTSVKVIFISIDSKYEGWEEKLAGFLEKTNIMTAIFHFDPDAFEQYISKEVPNWNRSLPLNLIYNKHGELVTSLGMTDQKEVKMMISRYKHFGISSSKLNLN